MFNLRLLPISELTRDPACRMRITPTSPRRLQALGRLLKEAFGGGSWSWSLAPHRRPAISTWPLPPAVVFDDGATKWVAAGWACLEAALAVGLAVFPCDVRAGSFLDAQFYALSANCHHGLPPTPGDTRRTALLALAHPLTRGWSEVQIARLVGLAHDVVGRLRHLSPAVKDTWGATTVTGFAGLPPALQERFRQRALPDGMPRIYSARNGLTVASLAVRDEGRTALRSGLPQFDKHAWRDHLRQVPPDQRLVDAVGQTVGPHLRPFFVSAWPIRGRDVAQELAQRIENDLAALMLQCEAPRWRSPWHDPDIVRQSVQVATQALRDLAQTLDAAQPHVVCDCGGYQRACPLCLGCGWLTEARAQQVLAASAAPDPDEEEGDEDPEEDDDGDEPDEDIVNGSAVSGRADAD